MKAEIKIPKGYRLLKRGELVKKGDRLLFQKRLFPAAMVSLTNNVWEKTLVSGDCNYSDFYIRKVKSK